MFETLPDFISAVVTLELAPEAGDFGQGARMLFLVLGVEQVGMQVSQQRVFGSAGDAKAIAQGVVSDG